MPQLGAGVVTGDAAVRMAEQCFAILLSHACCTQPSAKGVLQVVNADTGETIMCRPQILRRLGPGLLPGLVVHAVNHCFVAFQRRGRGRARCQPGAGG